MEAVEAMQSFLYPCRAKKELTCKGMSDIALDQEGLLVVVEEFGHCVSKWDTKKAFRPIAVFGQKGSKPGEFHYPTAIAIDEKNQYYITDRWNHRVQVCDCYGVFKQGWGTHGSQDNEFSEPWGIALTSSGDVCVVDHGNACIKFFDKRGTLKRKYGQRGVPIDFYEGERFKRNFHYEQWVKSVDMLDTIERRFYENKYEVGEFEYPEQIAVSSDGLVYITDRVSERMVVVPMHDIHKGALQSDAILSLPAAPISVHACQDHIFIGFAKTKNIVWCHKQTERLIDLEEVNLVPSTMCFDHVNNCLYVADVWKNQIAMLDLT